MSHILQSHLSRRQALMDAIQNVLTRAQDDGERDLTPAELSVITEHREAVDAMAPAIAELELVQRSADESERLRGFLRNTPATIQRTDRYEYQSGAQFVLDRAAVQEGNRINAPAEYLRAAQDRLERAGTITTDTPGLLPTPVVGGIVNLIDTNRPIVSSSNRQPMPQYGSTFVRPVVTQHTLAGGPKAELVVGASRTFIVARTTVTKGTYGGWVDLSREDIDWSTPALLDIVYQDLQVQTGLQTEDAAATLLETVLADVAQKIVLVAAPTAAQVTAAIYAACALVYAGAKRMPDTLYVAIDVWGKLGGITDTTGRPLFPDMGPTGFGANPFGLKMVVSPFLNAGAMIVGVSSHLETYSSDWGFTQTILASANGYQVAFWSAYAQTLINGTKSFAWLAP